MGIDRHLLHGACDLACEIGGLGNGIRLFLGTLCHTIDGTPHLLYRIGGAGPPNRIASG